MSSLLHLFRGRLAAAAIPLLLSCGTTPTTASSTDSGDDSATVTSETTGDGALEVATRSACDVATTPSITTIGSMSTGRYSPSVAALDDGTILIAGGFDFVRGLTVSGAELLDPRTALLTATGPLLHDRNFATIDAIGPDFVVIGGFSQTSGSLPTAERWTRATMKFSAIGRMRSPREAHTTTRLVDGRYLVVGGLIASGFTFLSTAEALDAGASGFALAATMGAPRAFHVAVPTSGAKVLVIGGDTGGGESSSAELFDPTTNTFSPAKAALSRGSKALAAAAIGDSILVAGGANAKDGTLSDSTVFDPAADVATPTAPMATRRIAHTLTTLKDGRVIAIGGFTDSSSPRASTEVLELFDPTARTWTTLPIQLAKARHDHRAIVLGDCRVVVVGGQHAVDGAASDSPREIEVITVPTGR